MAGDFEEKYLLLRDENTALKRKKNEQEATIKRMYTKLAIIEESMKKKRLADDQDNQDEQDGALNGNGGGSANGVNGTAQIPLKRDLDTEKFVQSLKNENVQLRKKNQALMEKNRVMEEKMRQHQLKYHSNPKVPSASVTNANMNRKMTAAAPTTSAKVHNIAVKRAAGGDGEPLDRQVDRARHVHRDNLSGDLEMALKNRLVVAEKQLVKLQSENEQLRKGSSSSRSLRQASGHNNSNNNDDDDNNNNADEANDSRISSMDVEHMKRELRDRQAQVAILNARYENLEANNAAEREIQEKTIEQLEHMNRQVHKLRSQLQDVSLEKEHLEVRLSKAADLEREIVMLRDQNRKLEERMTSLCESPFINDAFQRKERIDKLFDLEKLTQQQKETINHMTEEHQKLQVVVKELQSNVKLMKQAKEMVEQDMDRLRQQLGEERNARSLSAMTPYPVVTPQQVTRAPSPQRPLPISTQVATTQPERRDAASSPLKGQQPAPVKSASFASAMPVVTRRYPDQTLFEPIDTGGADDNSIKHLRNRIHVLQLAHLKAIQELERCEKMLHAQTSINRELAEEIEELTTKNVSSSGALQKRLKEVELAVDERQQRIQMLEAQNRQLKYAREKLLRAQESDKKISELDFSSDEEDDRADVASVSESLVMAARDLSPGEQLLEIWILGASFDRTVISSNASTFVLCDFYDFESQSTPLLVGNRPEYNFASTFKVTVDAFFLRYLASEMLVFELHQAIQGDFRLVGRASVSLAALLRSRGVIKEPELPIKLAFGADHDNVIGSLNAVVRLAAPISEIWKLHLRSFPQDIQLLRTHRLAAAAIDPVDEYLLEDGFDNNHEKAVNELQITVFACRGLRSYTKKKANGAALSTTPSSYVHYQILGFPDVFTNIVPSTTSPEFDLHVSKQFFAVEVDVCLLHFFSKFQLWLTVFDDQADVETENATDGAIGRCSLLLEELVKGESIRGWFQLRDRNDQPAGEISVLIEWRDPFQVAQLYSSSRRAGSSKPASDLHSLDYDQQHAVMRMFAPEMDGRVNYRQFLMYALPPESLELVTSKIKERLEYAIDTEQLECVDDLFLPAGDNPRGRDQHLTEITVVDFQKRIERFGVFLSSGELELLEQVFAKRQASAASGETARRLVVHYVRQHINPRMSCAERLLLHKIRHTLRVFQQPDRSTKKPTSGSPYQSFERYDHAQSGFVSRAEFKRCLGVLGFELLDIDKSYKEFMEKESRAAANECPDETKDGMKSNQGDNQAKTDLDEETLVKTDAVHPVQVQATLPKESSAKGKVPTIAKPSQRKPEPSNQVAEDPRTEFDRRKELFLERMKTIASSSAKSLVYEQLEKKKETRRRQQVESANAACANPSQPSGSLSERVQQQLTQLHVPRPLHHDAARILQRQFRRFRMQRAVAAPSVGVPQPQPTTNAWYPMFADSLRARLWRRAGCKDAIPIGENISQLCHKLDPAFADFDRDGKGYLATDEIARGFTALKFDLSSDQIAFFLRMAGVFRHTNGAASLSRMEFDAFTLDPSAPLLLRRLSDLLYQPSDEDPSKPRIAQLSRLFIKREQPDHAGVVPLATAWKIIGEVTTQQLSKRDQQRLQILFDVQRNRVFAYKLFVKVMSQWHTTTTSQGAMQPPTVSPSHAAAAARRQVESLSEANAEPPRVTSSSQHEAGLPTRPPQETTERSLAAPAQPRKQVQFESTTSGLPESPSKVRHPKKGTKQLPDKTHGGGSSRQESKHDDSDDSKTQEEGEAKSSRDDTRPRRQATESSQTKEATERVQPAIETAMATIRQLYASCESHGRDFRGAFEQADPQYSGLVPALDFKSVLLELGFLRAAGREKNNSKTRAEAMIGVLVREFRVAESRDRDGVQYTAMLARALLGSSPPQSSQSHAWLPAFTDSLRTRIRQRGGFQGAIPIDHNISVLCEKLDTAFAHFDRDAKGFLDQLSVATGLTALKYGLSSDQIAVFLQTAGVYRNSNGNGTGGLSRMEFDSFVLDPSASLLLGRLADSLYQRSDDDPGVPRIAQLSRLFITRDQPTHKGVLPLSIACQSISEVTQHDITKRDQHRLQILFDVNRDGAFAYKLFMKVMSQWHTKKGAPRAAELPQPSGRVSSVSTSSSSKAEAAAPAIQCSRDDVVRALYNQLSSVDFDSQIEIFEDYLRRRDTNRSGRISLDDLERILERIKLKLSKEALTCLRDSFSRRSQTQEDDNDERGGGWINYKAVLKGIQVQREQDDDE